MQSTIKIADYPDGFNFENSILISTMVLADSGAYKVQNRNYNTYLQKNGIYMYLEVTGDEGNSCKIMLYKNSL